MRMTGTNPPDSLRPDDRAGEREEEGEVEVGRGRRGTARERGWAREGGRSAALGAGSPEAAVSEVGRRVK